MVGTPIRDRRTERREATKLEILGAAWDLVRAEGLAALTLRDLATKVGMQPPSLYSYFDSKHAIYDAMFLQGNLELLRRYEAIADEGDDAGTPFGPVPGFSSVSRSRTRLGPSSCSCAP